MIKIQYLHQRQS